MLTLEQTAIVTAEHKLTFDEPPIVSPGEHRITVVMDTAVSTARPGAGRRLNLIPLQLNNPPEFTYRREELYADHGR